MAHYMLQTTHSEAECLKALDEVAEQNPKLLDICWMGCGEGDHTGWATVEAKSEADARGMLPPTLRRDSKIVKVDKYTKEQIRGFHKEVA